MLQGLFTKNEPTSSCIYLQHRYPCICLFKCGRCIYFSHIGAQLILDWNFQPAAQSAVTDGCWVVFCTSKIMGGGFWTPQFRRTLRGQERVASLAGCESSAPRWARPQCNPYLQKLVPSELDKKEGKLCIWSRAVAFSGGIFMRFLGPKAIMAGWNSRVSQSYIDGRFSIGIIRLLRFCLLEEIDQT